MAQIYPQWIPKSERENNPGRRAEYLVYDHLNDQLGDDWLVLYSQAIKWAHQGGVGDREADFIVAHPKLGVVMLEVKGGSIERKDGQWYSTPLSQLDRPKAQQQPHKIKNPYEQATSAAKSYQRKLDNFARNQGGPRSERLPERVFDIATAVCFPDIDTPPGVHLSGDALPELTLTHQDLPNLKDRLYEIFQTYRGQAGAAPGKAGIDLLVAVLARDWKIESYLAYEFETVEERRKQLTEEQFQLLYSLEYNPQLLIAGCAGSGKTMLAMEKARQLASQGQQVLFTCFNGQLAGWLKQRPFLRENITINHFHRLCRKYAGQAGVELADVWSTNLGVSKSAYFSNLMPEALELAAVELDLSFDAVIVDEGQDFEESWLQVLRQLLKNPDRDTFYIFYDDNQKVYGTRNNIPFQWPMFRLTRNLRNTNPIFKLILNYYHEPQRMISSGISGPEPLFVSPHDYDGDSAALETILTRLVEEQIQPAQIAVLTPLSRQKSRWNRVRFQNGGHKLVWSVTSSQNQVTCSTIRTFKGLERPVIVLTELDGLEAWQVARMMYVAISRARNQLIVLGDLPKLESEEDEDIF
jgi:hypothetical protein